MKTSIEDLCNMRQSDAHDCLFLGIIGQRDYDRHSFLWSWCAPRYTGFAGAKQKGYWLNHGTAALTARINRVRRVAGLDPLV